MIKKGYSHEKAFEEKWRNISIDPKGGLYHEILTLVELNSDPKFNTFSMTDEAYKTYINIGIWKDLKSFDDAVGRYIQVPKDSRHLLISVVFKGVFNVRDRHSGAAIDVEAARRFSRRHHR
jgi:hypothetical protein